jgi:hypothetical protein
MKKQLNLHRLCFTLALLLTAAWSFAGGDDGEKQKTYTKSYPVSATEKISINNEFGEVKIVTWDKPEVNISISITVHASTDEKAQSILDGITIADGKNSDGVYFKTSMTGTHDDGERHDRDKDDKDKDDKDKGDKGRGNRKNSSGMEINYVVSMPAGNPLKLVNQFGRSIVPDLSGPVEITEKFGDLVAGRLSNVKEVHVEFGSATIESINNGKLVVSYSKAEIKKVSGNIKGIFEFCDKIKLPLDNGVTNFNLINSYSNIEITVSSNFGGDFAIHTNFGDFHNGTPFPIKEVKDEDEHGPKFDNDYTGKSGNGSCKVKIKSDFGNIRLI